MAFPAATQSNAPAASALAVCCTPGDKDFPKVGGNLGNQAYSSLTQIHKGNIRQLYNVLLQAAMFATGEGIDRRDMEAAAIDVGEAPEPTSGFSFGSDQNHQPTFNRPPEAKSDMCTAQSRRKRAAVSAR